MDAEGRATQGAVAERPGVRGIRNTPDDTAQRAGIIFKHSFNLQHEKKL
jgi:hypothetical protein